MKKGYYVFIFIFLGVTSIAEAQVDYATQVQPIFNANCTSCHGSNGGVDLRSFSALMSSVGNNYGTNVVVPGNPDASGLVDKIENANPQFGNSMPPNGSLAQTEIDMIRLWISEGANEVATSNEFDSQLPTSYRLIGNYPNPFNPSTQIQFELPESAQYTISIFSVHGQLLLEEVGFASAGVASISVDMQTNPTGVYLYHVSAVVNGQANLIGTGRMTLIK